MLPGEIIKELLCRFGSTGLHVFDTPPNCFNRFLIVLSFPLEIVGQRIVKRVCGTLTAPTRKVFKLGEPFWL